MTQSELRTFVLRLRCCSAEMATELALKLSKGEKCSNKKLIILNGIIKTLLPYVVDGEDNCLTEDQYLDIVDNGRQLCAICDCQ